METLGDIGALAEDIRAKVERNPELLERLRREWREEGVQAEIEAAEFERELCGNAASIEETYSPENMVALASVSQIAIMHENPENFSYWLLERQAQAEAMMYLALQRKSMRAAGRAIPRQQARRNIGRGGAAGRRSCTRRRVARAGDKAGDSD